MFDYLYQVHEVFLFFLIAGFSIVLSVFSVLLVHRYIPLNLRYKENSVIGNMSALISIIYGVLVGLMALYLINNLTETSNAVQREANAIANIYRDSQWLSDPTRDQLQLQIRDYIQHTINMEWPLMKKGQEVSHDGDHFIDQMSQLLKHYQSVKPSDSVIMQELVGELKTLYNAREERITASGSSLSPEIWMVVIVGTILTVLINYLFGMHLLLHIITASAATLMAFSMVFLLVTLDRPFQGEFVLEADAFKPLLEFVQTDLSTSNNN